MEKIVENLQPVNKFCFKWIFFGIFHIWNLNKKKRKNLLSREYSGISFWNYLIKSTIYTIILCQSSQKSPIKIQFHNFTNLNRFSSTSTTPSNDSDRHSNFLICCILKFTDHPLTWFLNRCWHQLRHNMQISVHWPFKSAQVFWQIILWAEYDKD